MSNHWAEGGAGARALAEAVIATCEGESAFRFLYDLNLPIAQKIEIVCKEIYRAAGIELSEHASKQLETYTRQGYGNLPSKSSSYTCELIFIPLIQFAWQRPNTHSLMTHPLKMLLRASPSPSVKCAYLLEPASYTLSSETCRPCQGLAHAQVSDTMCFIQKLSHETLSRRILGSWT